MSTSDNPDPEEEFVVLLNKVMTKGLQADADPDVMAKVCLNTARELYDHYGAGDGHGNYLEYVTSVGFEAAEIEEWLDAVEGRDWRE